MSPVTPRHAASLKHPTVVLGAAGVGAALLTFLHVPAGALIGSLLGSMFANRVFFASGAAKPLPAGVRIGGMILLGCVVGLQLGLHTLLILVDAAAPLFGAVLLLLLLDLALACILIWRYRVDAVSAVFACSPGGLSVIAPMASESGARLGIVLAIHTVRILAVVVLLVPLLRLLLGSP